MKCDAQVNDARSARNSSRADGPKGTKGPDENVDSAKPEYSRRSGAAVRKRGNLVREACPTFQPAGGGGSFPGITAAAPRRATPPPGAEPSRRKLGHWEQGQQRPRPRNHQRCG